ncbi:hypothetical protein L873DRAFT_921921 [Choiromyces venosus 120613-1]|uniref:Uncharacterized protein n=1 Tax=Choiromyces venosus 120613-1 TaxID=1336337 RepID=A0A3N4JTA1_9PEZI|nr:hypothetical protein L873DRAFT_921921 [Choiromyces venosus 120613-1]
MTSFHKIPNVLLTLQKANIISASIPVGCIYLIQVLDVAVNRSFKNSSKDVLDEELFQLVEIESTEILDLLDSSMNSSEDL